MKNEKPYLVSARKYRPTDFEEVVGQKNITDTLTQCIKENKMASAILFSGPKGVGKTTCARILAKKLNEGFLKNSDDLSFNIFELDGASNNSVEDIRNLIEQIRFTPQRGKYKVYIIDEVHMLSQAAFNAFLKTLEEPPSYVIFILATTEKHKVIPTILSRCQIYEFRSISTKDIVCHFKKISKIESIKASDEALFLIASQAEGSLRDALFLFDRIKISSSGEINLEIVENQLGILPMQAYSKGVEYISQKDIFSLLLHFDEIVKKGFNIDVFLGGLSGYLRNLLLLKNEKTHSLVEFPETLKEKLLKQSHLLEVNFLLAALEISKKGELELKMSKNRRLSMEITLMQLSQLENKNLPTPPKKNENNTEIPNKDQETTSVFIKKENETLLKTQKDLPSKEENESLKKKIEKEVILKKKTTFQNHKNEIEKIQQKKTYLINKDLNVGSFSIKEALREVQETSYEKIIEEKINLPFSKETFTNAWNLFINQLDLDKKNPLFGILKNISFELQENYHINLYFSSRAAISEFTSLEEEAKIFLKKELSNFSIKFIYKLKATELKKKNIYTLEEKYDFLMKKNIFLSKLIKIFHLDYL